MKKVAVFHTAKAKQSIDSLKTMLEPEVKVWGCEYVDLRYFVAKNKVNITVNQEDLSKFDLIYFRGIGSYADQVNIIRAALPDMGFISNLKPGNSFNKLFQHVVFAKNNLSIPETVFGMENVDKKILTAEINNKLGDYVVAKPINGAHGDDCHLLKSKKEIKHFISKANINYIWQRYIPNSCDYRLIIINGKVKFAIKRQRKIGGTEWRNNTSLGADRIIIPVKDLNKAIIDIAVKGCMALGYVIAGADVMINSDTGKPVLLEINSAPDLKTGTDKAVCEYIIKRI